MLSMLPSLVSQCNLPSSLIKFASKLYQPTVEPTPVMPSNVLGTPLQGCCNEPVTGFYRDGSVHTGPDDKGLHTVW